VFWGPSRDAGGGESSGETNRRFESRRASEKWKHGTRAILGTPSFMEKMENERRGHEKWKAEVVQEIKNLGNKVRTKVYARMQLIAGKKARKKLIREERKKE